LVREIPGKKASHNQETTSLEGDPLTGSGRTD
jgi:hypothetical protein